MAAEIPKPHVWQPEHLRLAVTAAGVALWACNVITDAFTMDERGFELWGLPWRSSVTFEELSAHIHPADRDRVRSAFAATRAVLGRYETDFRILIGDEVRWVSARGQGEDVGIVGRTMFGIFLDVTGRKQAEEGNELLAGEMSHRVKNLLAIAAGLTAITSRSAANTEDMARELTERLHALGRAHDLENFLLYRASELTVAQGYDWFVMADLDTEKKSRTTVDQPFASGPYGYWGPSWRYRGRGFGWRGWDPYGGDPFWDRQLDVRTVDRYEATAEIVIGRGPKPGADRRAFDARQVIANIGPGMATPS